MKTVHRELQEESQHFRSKGFVASNTFGDKLQTNPEICQLSRLDTVCTYKVICDFLGRRFLTASWALVYCGIGISLRNMQLVQVRDGMGCRLWGLFNGPPLSFPAIQQTLDAYMTFSYIFDCRLAPPNYNLNNTWIFLGTSWLTITALL